MNLIHSIEFISCEVLHFSWALVLFSDALVWQQNDGLNIKIISRTTGLQTSLSLMEAHDLISSLRSTNCNMEVQYLLNS